MNVELNNNEILFILQGIDLKLSRYAEKNIKDYPEWKIKKILELKKLREKIGKVAITKLKIGG
ncbi:hypothetical protein HTVC104P_gp10 [Pelagibacter phage HTVC104P]|nr:hypothetical protein HTVC104P_gp10 [Pelagibacter phage HTVC104P]